MSAPPRAPRPGPADTILYAIGDIHGALAPLLALQAMIAADAARRPARQRVIVHLGDYVDRGPASQAVIGHLLGAHLPGFATVHLRGNHEQLMLDFLDDPGRGGPWFANGGLATLASYGIPVALEAGRPGASETRRLHDALRSLLPRSHRDFLQGSRLQHRIGDYLFVHAGIRPGIGIANQRDDDLLWIREPFLSANNDHGAVVVHGHTITAAPQIRANRIGIDTGAYRTGVLTAVAIEGDRLDVLRTSP